MTVTTSMLPSDTPNLPAKVTQVPKDVLRNFPHSKKVGNYLLGNTLGEGSFAKVKEALHIPTGERVAIKIIDKKKSREDSYVRKNLRREGKILQMIRHGNIVQLLEIMETQNSYYLVTELCRGGDFMDYISKKRKLPESEVKRYICQIVSAVDYLHRLGILHRDLKIENLLLDEHRNIKIIDFGLSNCVKLLHTKDGPKIQELCVTQCGSPAYAAPELLGRQKYGPKVDIWSIGINMFAMLTGTLPFTVEPFNIKALHNKMVTGKMNPLPDKISKECRDLLKRLLNPDPDNRIGVEELMTHHWIVDIRGQSFPRAQCPNKVKADQIDNRILRHMVEMHGFKVGQIIRYITGNVPSTATAMYYLFHQKLLKNQDPLAMASRDWTNSDTEKVPRPRVYNKSKPSVTISPAKQTAESGGPRQTEETVKNNEKSENAKMQFSDILQTKGTHGVIEIPRANTSMKTYKAAPSKQSGYLPSVANKYILESQRQAYDKPVERRNENCTDNETTPVIKEAHSPEDTIKRTTLDSSSTNKDSTTDQDSFRQRASTFPSNTKRLAVPGVRYSAQKVVQNSSGESSPTPSYSVDNRLSGKKSNADKTDRLNAQVIPKRKTLIQYNTSPYYHRERDTVTSPYGRNNQHSTLMSNHTKLHRRILSSHYPQKVQEPRESHHGKEVEARTEAKSNILSRQIDTNRLKSVSNSNSNTDTVLEEKSDLSCASPISTHSHSISITNRNNRCATPLLPSLAK